MTACLVQQTAEDKIRSVLQPLFYYYNKSTVSHCYVKTFPLFPHRFCCWLQIFKKKSSNHPTIVDEICHVSIWVIVRGSQLTTHSVCSRRDQPSPISTWPPSKLDIAIFLTSLIICQTFCRLLVRQMFLSNFFVMIKCN